MKCIVSNLPTKYRSTRTFLDSHPQRSIGGAQNVMQILQNFSVGERYNLNRHTLSKLLKALRVRTSWILSRTHVGTEILHIFSVVGNEDEARRRK